MRQFLTACFASLLPVVLLAQKPLNFFQPVSENQIALRSEARRVLVPKNFTAYQLDFEAFKTALAAAPMEFTAAARAKKLPLELPQPDGTFERYTVWETQIMHPELAAKYPGIRTYAGQSLATPGKTVRMTVSVRGLRAKVFNPDMSVEFVETLAWGQTDFYMAYRRDDIPEEDKIRVPPSFLPSPEAVLDGGGNFAPGDPDEETRGTLIEPVRMKVFRFAVSTTGEFGQDVGNTKEEVLAKVVDVTNQVSAVYERDIQLRLQLIPNNDVLIFLEPAGDPFFGVTVGEWMSQNPLVLNQRVGPGAYDIGHNYARYITGGAIGVAGGLACIDSKARGCSGGGGSYGDGFESVIGQEVGHQLSGGHTWNRCGLVGGREGTTAFEPGSGSTIMSYAGACGSDNVQGGSDLYYHSGSIEEIRRFYNGNVGDCGTFVNTPNNHPEVTLPYKDNFFIPVGTPFELTGTATDPDGDPVSYCWEQMDIGPENPLETPQGSCPIFRTRPAVTANNRYFPRLQTILTNGFDVTEQLPAYTRDLTFRLTARDNRPDGGGVGWAEVAFKASGNAGPFVVKTPNTASTVWYTGEYALVSWDVANSDKPPVSCAKVNIRLSTDGGQTYPIMLAEGVVNDGSQYVLVPDNLTSSARVRVDGADNVFFDISNTNFKIQKPTAPALTIGLENDGGQLCLPDVFSTKIITAGLLGFSTPISLEMTGLPPGATAVFEKTTLTPGEETTLSIDLNQVAQEGTYTMDMLGYDAAGTDTVHRPITVTVVFNDFSDLALLSPADGSTGAGQSHILRWHPSKNGNTHDLQLGTSAKFEPATILYSRSDLTVDTFKIPVQLPKATAYFWRVRPKNECGTHAWSEPFFFSTFVDNCAVSEAQDLPKNLTANGTPSIESKINIVSPGTVNVLNVKQVKGFHESFKDLEVHLISPAGTDVLLFKNKCGSLNLAFNIGMSDDAPNLFQCPPSNAGVSVRPTDALSIFKNENITGVWKLAVKDNSFGGGGSIEGFRLEFCSSVSLNPPYVVNNNPLQLDPGTNSLIEPPLLLIEDANNTHSQLTFTLLALPKKGLLKVNGLDAALGDQFTQADLDAGALRYYDYGFNAGADAFRFIVYDGEGGWLGSTEFVIQPHPVGTSEQAQALGFALFPNPASSEVTLALGTPAGSDTRILVFNAAGQLVRQASLSAGNERLSLRTERLPEGIYSVMVQNEMGSGVKKLVVAGER